MQGLEYYRRKFEKLKTAIVDKKRAPHKPILLLSIIQSIELAEITENRIYISALLVARFKDNWHRLVHNEKFSPKFYLPFFHLQSEKFWHLQTLPGREILLTSSRSVKSFSHLKEVVAYAFFDPELFRYLLDTLSREILRQTLLANYFNKKE